MMYFVLWVLFLLAIILAVPIVSWLEKRKTRAAFGPQPDQIGEEEEAGEEEVAEAEPAAEEAVEEVAEFDAPGGEDFSAFEEIK